jgi:DNA-binding transcriptional MerR regulator
LQCICEKIRGVSTEPDSTVDELAHAHGLPVSTVRLYQTRGLLPPPRREGRVAYYGDEHRRRLRLITELQDRGFSLAAIKELVDGMAAGQSLQAVLGLGDAPSTWLPEEATSFTLAELVEQLPGLAPSPAMVERVVSLGLVQLSDDGTVLVESPAFLDIGRRLMQMGLPGETVLDEYEHLRTLTDDIAQRFTDVFRRHFWESFEAEGLPAGRIPELVSSLEQLGPLAEAVVTVALRRSLQAAAESFLDEQDPTTGRRAARLIVDLRQLNPPSPRPRGRLFLTAGRSMGQTRRNRRRAPAMAQRGRASWDASRDDGQGHPGGLWGGSERPPWPAASCS